MACRIEPHCNACGVCAANCPVGAILETTEQTRIVAALCTECLGYDEMPVCMSLCPEDAIRFAPQPPLRFTRTRPTSPYRRIIHE
jgi:ferredoxin